MYPQQQSCATVERKKSLTIAALSDMGLIGSYRAERHFKRFRYAFIHFIHKMITPLLLQIRDSPFSLVGIAGLGDDSSRQQSRTMKSNDRGRDGISLDEIRARSKE